MPVQFVQYPSPSLTPSPIRYILDGVEVQATRDTVTPANNRPVPMEIVGGALLNTVTADQGAPAVIGNAWYVRPTDGTHSQDYTAAGESLVSLNTAIPAGTNNIGDVDVITLPSIPAGTNNIGDVDVLTLPSIPAGNNNIGDVDVASLPGTVAADITAIKTAVEILDNIVSGSEAQVDVLTLPSLPAGTNNIGDVDVLTLPSIPAGTNNIGDVDVLTLPSIPAGTNNIGDVDVLTIPTAPGRSKVDLIRNDYTSTNVTTGAYVELVASTAAAINQLDIFDSSGQTLVLAVGPAASEADQFYISPGGNGKIELNIPAASRISVKAVSATASVGELIINSFS